MDTMLPPFVDLNYFRLIDVGQPIIHTKEFLLLPFGLIPCSPLPRISRLLTLLTIACFVVYFDAEDTTGNPSNIVTINRNVGQFTTTFYADTRKMALYDLYLSERIK